MKLFENSNKKRLIEAEITPQDIQKALDSEKANMSGFSLNKKPITFQGSWMNSLGVHNVRVKFEPLIKDNTPQPLYFDIRLEKAEKMFNDLINTYELEGKESEEFVKKFMFDAKDIIRPTKYFATTKDVVLWLKDMTEYLKNKKK